jgi:hypothetical protein
VGAGLGSSRLIHDASEAPPLRCRLGLLSAGGGARLDRDGPGVDFLSGEPWGVDARAVEGERPRGDSGRRKGEARCCEVELKLRGGFGGLEGFDCFGSEK